MPTGRNADHRRQHVAAMPTRAIRLTITWQCDMVVSPVVRHYFHSTFRHGAGRTQMRQSVRFLPIFARITLAYVLIDCMVITVSENVCCVHVCSVCARLGQVASTMLSVRCLRSSHVLRRFTRLSTSSSSAARNHQQPRRSLPYASFITTGRGPAYPTFWSAGYCTPYFYQGCQEGCKKLGF